MLGSGVLFSLELLSPDEFPMFWGIGLKIGIYVPHCLSYLL